MREIKKTLKYCKLLTQSFLFSGIDEKYASELFLSTECKCAQFEPKETIYSRTDFKKSMGLVLSGQLKVLKTAQDGSSIVLNMFSSGGVFGVAGLFSNTAQYVSEVVAVKRSRVMFLPQTLLRGLFSKQPRTAENYIAFLSDRICFLNSCIDHFTGGSAECRLSQYLLSLPACGKNPLMVKLPCSMTRLSDVLDIGRASLYRAFDVLTEEKIICRKNGTVEIIDFNRLKTEKF